MIGDGILTEMVSGMAYYRHFWLMQDKSLFSLAVYLYLEISYHDFSSFYFLEISERLHYSYAPWSRIAWPAADDSRRKEIFNLAITI